MKNKQTKDKKLKCTAVFSVQYRVVFNYNKIISYTRYPGTRVQYRV